MGYNASKQVEGSDPRRTAARRFCCKPGIRGTNGILGFEIESFLPLNYSFLGAWLSLVERLVRDQEAGGSNPLAPTNYPSALYGPCPRALPRPVISWAASKRR